MALKGNIRMAKKKKIKIAQNTEEKSWNAADADEDLNDQQICKLCNRE